MIEGRSFVQGSVHILKIEDVPRNLYLRLELQRDPLFLQGQDFPRCPSNYDRVFSFFLLFRQYGYGGYGRGYGYGGYGGYW